MTLAEQVQLQRAEEQANSARTRLETRFVERTLDRGRTRPLRFIGVRLPLPVYEALARVGPPAVVARNVIMQWTKRMAPIKRPSMGEP